MRKFVFGAFIFVIPSLNAQEIQSQDSLINPDARFDIIKVFPNPTSEILFIRNGEYIDSYQLINMNGELVQKGEHEVQVISLIDLPVGYYFLIMEIDGAFKRFRVQKY